MDCLKTIALSILVAAFTVPASARFYKSPFACGPDPAPSQVTVSYSFPGSGDATREFQAEIHTPQNVPMGVQQAAVIWSHGGGAGDVVRMRALAEATTEICYISISIGHPVVEDPVKAGFCINQGVSNAECEQVVGGLYKASDIIEMVSRVESIYGEIPIAVGGHSGGSDATMLVAGARRALESHLVAPGESIDFQDLRPEAFIALSPTGPHHDGFFGKGYLSEDTSWDLINRPVLMVTGDGDNTCGSIPFNCQGPAPPWNRRAPFAHMPGQRLGAEHKYELYIHDVEAFHNSFRLSEGNCGIGPGFVPQAKCDDIFEHIISAARGFVDLSLRRLGSAQGYLSSEAIENASPNLDVELSRK